MIPAMGLAIGIIIGLLLVASVMSTSVLEWLSTAASTRRNQRGPSPSQTPVGVGTEGRQ